MALEPERKGFLCKARAMTQVWMTPGSNDAGLDDAGLNGAQMTNTNASPGPREVRPGVLVYPDLPAVARAAAQEFVKLAGRFIATHGMFHAALSGGNTPAQLFRLLASDEFRLSIDWASTHLYWSDERCVPPDHPDSNFGMAQRELLQHISIPAGNIHRMKADVADLDRAAKDYEETLRQNLPLTSGGFPCFDLIFLGMGSDGHTASLFPGALFPGSEDPRQTSDWVVSPYVEKFQAHRMTLTLPVLNAAREVIFLVTGADKAESLRTVVEGTRNPPLPAQLVTVTNGHRLFLIDESAASLLIS